MRSVAKLLLIFTLGLCSTACGPKFNDTVSSSDDTRSEPPASSRVEDGFGVDFTAERIVPAHEFSDVYAVEEITDTVTTTLQGTVNEVCQAKGCWMTIATGDDQEMMVKFKDYGFFMPKDISGREVVMNGIAYYQTTSVDELRHYAEDAGKSDDEIAQITQPKQELHFLADGVQLLRLD